MHIPDSFVKEMSEMFGDRFRLRWSPIRHEFHLEQKVGSPQIIEPDVDDHGDYIYDDEYVRAQDGYRYIMTIRQGDRMPCPSCHYDINVPIMETRVFACPYCEVRIKAAFYPLNHTLLQHIRDIDPFEDGPRRVRDRQRARQLRAEAQRQKAALDEAGENVMDNKIQAFQVPMVGYGPKTAQRGDETRFQ